MSFIHSFSWKALPKGPTRYASENDGYKSPANEAGVGDAE